MRRKILLILVMLLSTIPLFASKVKLKKKLKKADSWTMPKGWMMIDNELSGDSYQFLLLKKPINMKSGTFEAVVNSIDITGKSWKVAGILLYVAKDQYWQMALIEKPDEYEKEPKGHFFELKCKQGELWGAERSLKRTKYKNSKWDYNKPYKLKIIFSPSTIEGIAEDSEGNIVANFAYELDKKVVKGGSIGLRSSQMLSTFNKLKLIGKK